MRNTGVKVFVVRPADIDVRPSDWTGHAEDYFSAVRLAMQHIEAWAGVRLWWVFDSNTANAAYVKALTVEAEQMVLV